ncbi:hypothetical protein BS17DRAFT_682164, partial [Gyrodon lividus]
PAKHARRTNPDTAAECLYASWKSLLPKLVEPYLQYSVQTLGKVLGAFSNNITLC